VDTTIAVTRSDFTPTLITSTPTGSPTSEPSSSSVTSDQRSTVLGLGLGLGLGLVILAIALGISAYCFIRHRRQRSPLATTTVGLMQPADPGAGSNNGMEQQQPLYPYPGINGQPTNIPYNHAPTNISSPAQLPDGNQIVYAELGSEERTELKA
jgi:hypothetical protein